MTMTDDAVIRELAARAEAAAPAMSLDPSTVLTAGRRHRRRRSQLRVATAAGFLGVTLAAVHLTAGSSDDPHLATSAVEVSGVTVTVVTEGVPVETDDGPAIDVGSAGDAEGNRLALAADASGTPLYTYDPANGAVDALMQVPGEAQPGQKYTSVGLDGTVTVVGFAAPDDTVTLRLAPAGGSPTLVDVPCLRLPGATTRVYVIRLSGTPSRTALPRASLEYTGPGGTGARSIDLRSLVPEETADGDGITVSVAHDVHDVTIGASTGVDTGIAVPPEAPGGTAAAADAPTFGVRVTHEGDAAALRLDGASDSLWIVDLATWLATEAPVPHAETWDRGAVALGLVPRGAHAVTLVVERSAGAERIPLPTFRIPGVDADVFLAVLTDTAAQPVSWPAVHLEVVGDDGAMSSWGLDGVLVS